MKLFIVTLKNINGIKYRRSIFSVYESFLIASLPSDADINYFIQVQENVQNSLNEFYTLLINLKQDENLIWDNIYHRTRDEINSFINNQEYEYGFKFPVSTADLDEYIRLYNDFAMHKSIRKAEAFRLKAYCQEGLLAVSFIRQRNNYLCINFYRLTQQRASNLYSFHLKHTNKEDFSGSHYGRAHKALHWLDMLACKKLGAELYDFCGWYNGSTDTHLLGINQFKEQFNGYKIKEYSGVIYKSFLLRLFKKLFRAG